VRALTILVLAIALAGCGLRGAQEARNEYQKSTDKYNECVAASPGMPQRCDTLRVAMEADGRKYNDVSPNFLDKLKPGDGRRSGTQYTECLAANKGTPENCETLRLASEAEQRKADEGFTFRPGSPPPDFANAQH
jgi:hypothetical protein